MSEKREGMDPGDYKSELRQASSFSRTSSTGSSLRHRSLRFPGAPSFLLDEDTASEIVSEAGDIGDRALSSNRQSESSSFRFSLDNALESGVVALDPENELLQSSGFWSNDAKASNAVYSVSPLPEENMSPMSTDAIVHTCDKKQEQQGKSMELPKLLDYMLCLVHLAVFGIFGVLTRYLLQKLFGPGVARVTSDHSILYLDLPSNMVGSFLMGWFGVVFKGDISSVSEFLAIGLSTGYLGSLTTFSGWNQKMLDASVNGHWVFSVLEFLLGLFLVGYSIIFGIETAKGFRWLLKRLHTSSKSETTGSVNKWRINSRQGHWVVLIVLMLLLAFLWSLSGTLLGKEFNSHNSGAQLWLACVVGPFGVWIRWFLARLNGRGIGRTGILKWVPFGTLIANVSAACVMAALSTLREAVNTSTCSTIVTGIQFGFLGCLSTVSTFAAEFHAMRESRHPWRAYVYTLITVGVSFGLGTLIYSVPVWTKGYN